MGVTLSFLGEVVDRMGRRRVVLRILLQLLCYAMYFLQPFLIRRLLGATALGADVVVCAAALAVSLLMPSVVDLLNNDLFQDARRFSKSVMWDTVLDRPYSYFVGRSSGEILSSINEASLAARRLEDTFVHAILRMLAMVVLYTASFCTLNVGLAVAYLAFIALFALLSVRSAKGGGKRVAQALQETASSNASVLDACRNIGSILTLRAARGERQRMDDRFGSEAKTYVDVQATTNRNAFVQQAALVVCALCFMLPVAFWTGEDLVVSQTTLLTLLYSILNLTGFGSQCLLIKELLDRVGASLASVGYGTDEHQREAREFDPAADAIRVEGVSFTYGEGPAVLDEVSCEFVRGQLSAVIGPNGCGKSTLLKVMAGLATAERGRVVLPCGSDETVMLLDQDATLFDRSILENVSYPGRDVDEDEVMELVGALGLGDVVRSKEQLRTLTPGELGDWVSGGEQQKILILRALVGKPAVLLCDEITANLDEGSTRTFYALLRERLPESCVVCVVHRKEELAFFDDVVRIAPGD